MRLYKTYLRQNNITQRVNESNYTCFLNLKELSLKRSLETGTGEWIWENFELTVGNTPTAMDEDEELE